MEHIRPEHSSPDTPETELIGTAEELRDFLHTQDWRAPSMNALAKELLDRVTPYDEVTPQTYVVITEQMLMDCYQGHNAFTGDPVPRELHRDPHAIATFRMNITGWAQSAFGEGFSEEVKVARDQYYCDLEEAINNSDEPQEG